MKRILVLILVIFAVTYAAVNEIAVLEWDRIYDKSISDRSEKIALQPSGEIYVQGKFQGQLDDGPALLSYLPNGNAEFLNFIDVVGDPETPAGLAIDKDGNYFTAICVYDDAEPGFNIKVKKFPKGSSVSIWQKDFDLVEDVFPNDIAVDAEGDLYLTGYIEASIGSDFFTIKFNGETGDTLWTRTRDYETSDYGVSIAVSDRVHLLGYTNEGGDLNFWHTRYLLDGGGRFWNLIYDSGDNDYGSAITLDSSGNCFLAGYTDNGSDIDFRVVKYDTAIDVVWDRTFDRGYEERIFGAACDVEGNLYVAGNSSDMGQSIYDLLIIKYNPEGDTVWTKTYDTYEGNWARDIAVDTAGNVYVAGTVITGSNTDFLVLKYKQITPGVEVTWPNGGEQLVIGADYSITWESEGPTDSVMIEFSNESVVGLDTIAVVANTGSYTWTVPDNPGVQSKIFISDLQNYSDIRDASDNNFYVVAEDVEELITTSIELEVFPDGLIRYQVPTVNDAYLKVYAVDGSVVKTDILTSSMGQVSCNELSAGVYYIRLSAGSESIVNKLVRIH